MDARSYGKVLHDPATRGQRLSAEERAELEGWYAAQDQAEAVFHSVPDSENEADGVRSSLDQALQQLQQVSAWIKKLERQNDAIRFENEVLQQRLARPR